YDSCFLLSFLTSWLIMVLLLSPYTWLFRSTGAGQDSAEDIPAKLVHPERVGQARALPAQRETLLDRVVRGDVRPDDGQQQRGDRSEEHTSELQSRENLVCRLLLEKKNHKHN